MSLAPPSKQSGSLTCTERIVWTQGRVISQDFGLSLSSLELNWGSGDMNRFRYDIDGDTDMIYDIWMNMIESSPDSWQARSKCMWVLNGPSNKCTRTHTHTHTCSDTQVLTAHKHAQRQVNFEQMYHTALHCIASSHDISATHMHVC